MSEEDKAFFQCDIFNFNLRDFCYMYMMGLRTYVLKEPLNNYEESKKKNKDALHRLLSSGDFILQFPGLANVSFVANDRCYSLLKIVLPLIDLDL